MRPVFLLTALCIAAGACGSDAPERPNVIVIVLDTTRSDRTSLNGYSRPTTPYLESLAAESTVYEDAWSPSCWTGPAHASLFTGLRPENHGYYIGVRSYLDDGADTLAEILARSGYETSCVSCNPTITPGLGLTQGFARYEFFPEVLDRPALDARRATTRALGIVRDCESRSRPYFLFINQWLPHLAYDPPEAVARRFLPADIPSDETLDARRFKPDLAGYLSMVQKRLSARDWSILSDLYDAEVATLDEEISRFVETLREEGRLDNTILVIAGDHGENLGDHGLCGHFFSLHRSVLRIPMLVRYPPAFRPGARVGGVTRLEDLFPTLLSLCGEPVPEGLDGVSLLDPVAGRPARAVLGGRVPMSVDGREFPEFRRTQLWRPLRSVYDGRFHLILRQDGNEEFYDVLADPREERNLAPRGHEDLRRLRGLLPRDPHGDTGE